MFLPDTHFGTDFKLNINATGLFCTVANMLPVVPLSFVLVLDVVISMRI